MKRLAFALYSLSLLFLTAGCSEDEVAKADTDYDQTKKMVVDILKTDDAKKALKEVMSEDEMKQQIVLDQQVVTDAIEKAMTSEKGLEFWKKAFEDPKFAASFAKSMKKEHEDLLKDLMKDPEYQGLLIEVFKNQEMEKQMITLLKSKEYKEYLQTVIQETLDSPLYQAKIEDILIKAADKKGKEESNKDEVKSNEEQ